MYAVTHHRDPSVNDLTQQEADALVDQASNDSFPASDPPSRTLIVRPGPPTQNKETDPATHPVEDGKRE